MITVIVVYEFVPNPFTENTKLEYVVNSHLDIICSIYALNGRVVKKLEISRNVPGKYSILWDGIDKYNNDVAAGIYLVKLMFKTTGQTFV